jgi:hypothetical protein
LNRILVGGFAPASAFTLAWPSFAAPVVGANVDKVWWDRWGNRRPNPRWGYPVRRCWPGPYGHLNGHD